MGDFYFLLAEIQAYVLEQFAKRALYEWLLFFFPLVLFFEAPRYFLPVLVLPLCRFLGYRESCDPAVRNFLRSRPSVSIVVAGRNEEKIIGSTIESLLSLDYPNKEIIVVDDCSDDGTYAVCAEYARRGLIRLFRNNSPCGRGGRPIASNFGFRMARGDFIISVDADTSYDHDIIEHMIGPFHDRGVGVVAGNLKVRNANTNMLTAMQTLEYAISISLWKRWTSLVGSTLQASGAFGAFRRETLRDFGGWDPELAEDADLSIKAKKSGWRIVFAPAAIAMTNVPEKLMTLVKQRVRWDKGTVRTYFHKHGNILMFWRHSPTYIIEVALEYLMVYLAPFFYAFYVFWMLWHDWRIFLFAYSVAYLIYVVMTAVSLLTALSFSERRGDEWGQLWYCPVFPLYKEIFRWVRLYANIMETMRWNYEESYIPKSGYRHSPRW